MDTADGTQHSKNMIWQCCRSDSVYSVFISVTEANWQRLKNIAPTYTLAMKWTIQLDPTGLVWIVIYLQSIHSCCQVRNNGYLISWQCTLECQINV